VSSIGISQVGSRKERDAFIQFPWQIYRNDPIWVPPLILERKEFLDPKRHPFYEHGEAALFLAKRNGEIVGRIMASDDPRYNSLHQSNLGCFGLFESINDREVAAALFEAADSWLRSRGRTEIMGPIDYSTNYVCGLLIDGFQYPPTLLTAHNPPYYGELIESCAFTKTKDWYAWWFSDVQKPVERLQRIAMKRAEKHGVTIRPMNIKKIADESVRLRRVFNQAWEKNWGFVPLTEAEAEHMAKEMKPLLMREMTLIAEIDKEPVGFVICLPDLNVALRHINGRLTRFGLPIGLIKLLYYKSRIRTARFGALGVVEKYRRAGIAEALTLRIIQEGSSRGFTAELSMTLEDNVMVNRFIEAMGASHYKTYRIYRRSVGGKKG
jgi:GNAT superfamily N-acetyltransferase